MAVAEPIEALDEHKPASALILAVNGQEITGVSLSETFIICEQDEELPFTSVAVHVTVVIPTE